MTRIAPVILCGGSGTRLWPLSREIYPKQFVDLGDGRTLFKDTLDRVLRIPGSQEPVVICNEAHRFYVAASLRETGANAAIILEPAPRNTAPAIALAALFLTEAGADPLMLILPSDHLIEDEEAFMRGVEAACPLAEQGYIVTFGITPTSAETGFGYIEAGEALAGQGFRIARFVEKPDSATAEAMLEQGSFLWNSGIFLMRASLYLRELERFAPEIAASCREAWNMHAPDGAFCRPGEEAFLASPANSIDYAVMEHTRQAAVVPLDTRWSDLGSWEAFYQAGQPDANGNVCRGDVVTHDTHNCYFNARHRLVTGIGLKGLAIVETRDALLVAPRDRVQEVKEVVGRLAAAGRKECKQHLKVYRPWGSYETLAMGDRFQVKLIIVDPGEELSLQLHHHRAEHWVVVRGTAEVVNGEDTRLFTEDQSTYIPLGTAHKLRNPGRIPLVLIEIQSGSYLDEDDIVRFSDIYGREGKRQ